MYNIHKPSGLSFRPLGCRSLVNAKKDVAKHPVPWKGPNSPWHGTCSLHSVARPTLLISCGAIGCHDYGLIFPCLIPEGCVTLPVRLSRHSKPKWLCNNVKQCLKERALSLQWVQCLLNHFRSPKQLSIAPFVASMHVICQYRLISSAVSLLFIPFKKLLYRSALSTSGCWRFHCLLFNNMSFNGRKFAWF